MNTAFARRAGVSDPAAVAQHLDDVAVALVSSGVSCQVTYTAGAPVLVTGPPAGPNAVSVAIDPDMHAEPGMQLDCTCVWTPAQGTTPQATAATIAAVLRAVDGSQIRCRPDAADAARLAAFLSNHPGWSTFWDPRYGVWRAAEDDPASVLYIEAPDADAVMTYISSHC